jgi:hypothetical protein
MAMRALLRFAQADFMEIGKFTLIGWACFGVIHIGQTTFRPSISFLALLLPVLLVIVGSARTVFFCLFYLLNKRDFSVAYNRLRGRDRSSG